MQYAVNENLSLTAGVQNILGKDAPLLGSTVNEQANTWPATYATLGRQLFVGASVRF
jgi:outer membrane receptor for ferrienterochelin and colicin